MATLRIRMESVFVIDRDLFARTDVAECKEQHVAVDRAHKGVGRARVVDIVRAIAPTAAIKAPLAIDVADAQLRAVCPPFGFAIRNSLAGVFGNLAPALKSNRGKAATTIYG